jgi:uncharacterized DUF497 family protein
MSAVRPYDFDPEKERVNIRKHRRTFDDGYRMLVQPPDLLLSVFDEASSDEHGEDRWIAIGPDPALPHAISVVVYTIRGDRLRLISVRPAKPRERHDHAHRFD